MTIYQKIQALTRQLLPTGRAFKTPYNGFFDKMYNGLAVSEEKAYNDSVAILDSLLPDNSNFTNQDATDWERRLGLPDGSANTLAARMAAIKRKLNDPGINPAKGNYLYIQSQLQLAGFNVYVYENIPNNTPMSYGYPNTTAPLQYGQAQYGSGSYGVGFINKCVNYIDEQKDASFSLGGSYAFSFFIGGPTIGSMANVPLTRKAEFRQLILKLKQLQCVALLYVNYI